MAGSIGEKHRVEAIEFESHETRLAGSIVFPANGKIKSAAVFVHGSGEQTRNMLWAERFANEGTKANRASARKIFRCWRMMQFRR
jgi:hypothetical protein